MSAKAKVGVLNAITAMVTGILDATALTNSTPKAKEGVKEEIRELKGDTKGILTGPHKGLKEATLMAKAIPQRTLRAISPGPRTTVAKRG